MAAAPNSPAKAVDLTDVDMFLRGGHHGALKRLRDTDPVFFNPMGDGDGFWVITRYDDVAACYRDSGRLSSRRGAILGGSFGDARHDSASGRMLVASDSPRHRMLRRLVHPMFGAAIVARIAAQVNTLLDNAFRKLCADGGGDFATAIAPELPAGALMVLFDIGHDDAHELIRLTRSMIGYRDHRYRDPAVPADVHLARTQAEMLAFFADLLAERRAVPGDDLVSRLAWAELNGRPTTDADVLYNCLNVAVGGDETASYTACSGLLALIEHPDQYDRLRAAPDGLGAAVEEILRWSSTNAYVRRVAVTDIDMHGRRIKAGDSVTLWNVSANFDERVFPEPYRFDLGRRPNPHLTYGCGPHRCVGAPGGTAELNAVFARLATAPFRLSLAGPVEQLRSNFILGTNALPVAVGAG
jgi:cytochrome P450